MEISGVSQEVYICSLLGCLTLVVFFCAPARTRTPTAFMISNNNNEVGGFKLQNPTGGRKENVRKRRKK